MMVKSGRPELLDIIYQWRKGRFAKVLCPEI